MIDDTLGWRGDPAMVDWRRERIRRECSGPRDGFVVTDIDLALRYYGERYDTDDQFGRLRIVEFKHGATPVNKGQRMIYKMISRACAETYGERFEGAWLIREDYPEPGKYRAEHFQESRAVNFDDFTQVLDWLDPKRDAA